MKKIITINLLTFFLLLVIIESTSYLILQLNYHKPSFLWKKERVKTVQIEKRNSTVSETHISSIDPHLGYSWLGDDITIDTKNRPYLSFVNGFSCYSDNPLEGKSLKFVCLGGSTTDGSIQSYSWPESLFLKLRKDEMDIIVHNGGISGYSSSQELIKLIRDVIPFKPDVVISLTGVNDFDNLHSLPKHPMVNHYQSMLMSFVYEQSNNDATILPASRLLISEFKKRILKIKEKSINGVSLGLECDLTPYENWQKNIRLMKSICDTFNVQFHAFLQPTMGIGEFHPSQNEKSMYLDMIKFKGVDYENDLHDFYKQAILFCKNYEFAHDLTNIFKNVNNVYRDPRHQNEKGVDIISKEIRKVVFAY